MKRIGSLAACAAILALCTDLEGMEHNQSLLGKLFEPIIAESSDKKMIIGAGIAITGALALALPVHRWAKNRAQRQRIENVFEQTARQSPLGYDIEKEIASLEVEIAKLEAQKTASIGSLTQLRTRKALEDEERNTDSLSASIFQKKAIDKETSTKTRSLCRYLR